jgi:hypothetical protein
LRDVFKSMSALKCHRDRTNKVKFNKEFEFKLRSCVAAVSGNN